MDRDVKGKVVVVTGSADGLGLAMVKRFLQKGAKLAVILDINEKQGNEIVTSLKPIYGEDRVVFYKCDVTTDLDTVFDKVIAAYKNVDILINNAAVLNECNIKQTIDINNTALMEWTMKFYDYMRLDKGGKGGTIINVSSIFGYRITPFFPYYHASKFAVLGFSKSLGHELNFKTSGVRVVTLCPGLTYTNMANNAKIREEHLVPQFNKSLKEDYEWQDPEDIGRGTVEIFEKSDSGSVWLVEGRRPAEKLDIF